MNQFCSLVGPEDQRAGLNCSDLLHLLQPPNHLRIVRAEGIRHFRFQNHSITEGIILSNHITFTLIGLKPEPGEQCSRTASVSLACLSKILIPTLLDCGMRRSDTGIRKCITKVVLEKVINQPYAVKPSVAASVRNHCQTALYGIVLIERNFKCRIKILLRDFFTNLKGFSGYGCIRHHEVLYILGSVRFMNPHQRHDKRCNQHPCTPFSHYLFVHCFLLPSCKTVPPLR